MALLEKDIKAQIIHFLKWKKVMCWVQSNVGIYDPTKNKFRTLNGTGQRKGVADILGIHQTRMLAIEVKTPRGQLSVHQWNFLRDVHQAGGIAIVACSVDVVEKCLFQDQNAPHGNLADVKPPKEFA